MEITYHFPPNNLSFLFEEASGILSCNLCNFSQFSFSIVESIVEVLDEDEGYSLMNIIKSGPSALYYCYE